MIRLIFMIALLPGVSAFGQCTPAPSEKTRWGGNTNVVIQESRPTRSIHGTVKDRADKALADVLVEVYDHPEIVLQDPRPDRDGQRRIAVCISGVAGRFSLDVPPGDYELRFSKASEWNVTSILVRVAKSTSLPAKQMLVRLTAGQ